MASWPATLPSLPLLRGWSESEPDIVLRTPMEVGPPKGRRRSTAGVRPQTVSLVLTLDERATFRTWFADQVAHGALPFQWTHPIERVAIALRITAPPKWDSVGDPKQVQLTLQLEVLP